MTTTQHKNYDADDRRHADMYVIGMDGRVITIADVGEIGALATTLEYALRDEKGVLGIQTPLEGEGVRFMRVAAIASVDLIVRKES